MCEGGCAEGESGREEVGGWGGYICPDGRLRVDPRTGDYGTPFLGIDLEVESQPLGAKQIAVLTESLCVVHT